MNKHAYLIIAHNQFDILKKILKILDDEKHDFFIHIDKKCQDLDFKDIESSVLRSKLTFVERISVSWGDFSQIQCEMSLLEAAAQNHYSYYHLISGVDMPLKTKYDIYNFFEENSGKEFVHFEQREIRSDILNRIKYYHIFTEKAKRSSFYRILEALIIRTQMLFGVNRIKNADIKFNFGSNWFSITDDLAQYAIQKKELIKKFFVKSVCADEMFLQTIVANSNFINNLYDKNFEMGYKSVVRFVDWKRGNPYVFHSEDFDELINSDNMFARKFDLNVDGKIVDMLYDYIMQKQK